MKPNNLTSNRILYFDYLEVLAIFLVVSIHRSWFDLSYSASILSIICSICVPLFFMVNGALLFHRSFDLKKHIHKIVAMFIALEGWRILYFLTCLLTNQIQLNTFSKSDIWNYLCGSMNLDRVPTAHMWFTNTLLFLYILFPLLKICWDHNKSVLYFFIIICGCFFQLSEEINVLLAQFTTLLHKNSVFTVDGFRATLSPLYNNGHFLVFMCIGIFVLFSSFDFNRVSKKINNTVSFISKRTLDIYYIHMFFAAIALDYIYPKVQVANVLINSVRTLIIIIIALVIGQFFRKLPVLKHLLNA